MKKGSDGVSLRGGGGRRRGGEKAGEGCVCDNAFITLTTQEQEAIRRSSLSP